MNSSTLLLSFLLQVIAPLVVIFMVQRLLLSYRERLYKKHDLPLAYLQPKLNQERRKLERNPQHAHVRMISDWILVSRLIFVPLMILLIFNFRNSFQDAPEAATHQGVRNQSAYKSIAPPANADGQSNQRSGSIPSMRPTPEPITPVSFSIRIGLTILLMSLSTALILIHLRFHPHASSEVNYQPSDIWHNWHAITDGPILLQRLGWWWKINLPLIIILQLQILPEIVLGTLYRILPLLIISAIAYGLWQLRPWVKARLAYKELLAETTIKINLLDIQYIWQRLAFDQEPSHRAFMRISLQSHALLQRTLLALLLATTLWGYQP
ncbi:hypothetical protein PVA45_07725 (plasmid) [Entomospira entomophila]|uniref:Uncharacterized protein n=1 Tax=Entomospira entomophila TaxID=2719988 RepID=A0A968GBB4_9SPIO|nr:hypothetical protein [Entomospira entomophilus]NIZ41392.1 hypothetical protein [Entomospira entomophilus]WDI36342.1 hypothetical protein PVA45_07725 [Entomospira entomophilus]